MERMQFSQGGGSAHARSERTIQTADNYEYLGDWMHRFIKGFEVKRVFLR